MFPLFILVSSGLTRPLECAKGSEVWCQNFKTASECGAVEHCQQTFWSKATEVNSCRDWVSAYGRSVVHLLLEETDPDLVCGALRLGSPRGLGRGLGGPPAASALTTSGAFCEVCKMFDGYLDRSLDKNSTQAMILSAFHKACGMLPEAYRSKCDEFVKEYEPILIAALHEELDPASLCLKIGACPKEAAGPPLRTEQCMWGPSYWCKSMETAVLCNAVDHCKNHKWK
uniref:Prosaposin n=1 Tax=Monodelphis domestica TaxID=13616 RepID=K7E0S6_MONDO